MSRPIRHLTAEQKQVVEELNRLRTQLPGAQTEQEFARRYLPCSYDTWRHLRLDDYTGNTDKWCSQLVRVLGKIKSMLASMRIEEGSEEFHENSISKAVLAAVQIASEKTDENRLVIYKAPTGGGKSAICRQLARKYKSPIIQGTESMRTSYFAVCSSICKAFGSPGPWKSREKVEEEMLALLNQRETVLIIDEANSFGPAALNAIKLILNVTQTTVFMAAIPAIFDRMRYKSWFEASQVIRRVEAILEHPHFTRDSVAPFFKGFTFPDGRAAALERIASASEQFGMYDMVKRVREELLRSGCRHEATADRIEDAIRLAETKTEAYRILK